MTKQAPKVSRKSPGYRGLKKGYSPRNPSDRLKGPENQANRATVRHLEQKNSRTLVRVSKGEGREAAGGGGKEDRIDHDHGGDKVEPRT